jgi:AraC-like DNA-binding protein
VESGAELLEAVHQGTVDIAVVSPCAFGEEAESRRDLASLVNRMVDGSVVLYVPPKDCTTDFLQGVGLRLVVIEGVDDDRTSMKKVFAEAATAVILARVKERLAGYVDEVRLGFLVHLLASTIRSASVPDLARILGTTPRELRGQVGRMALPLPSRLIQVGRLCHALGFAAVGVRSTTRVAYLVGYHDTSSLCRSFRNRLGKEFGAVVAADPDSLLAEALLPDLITDP